MTLKTKSKGERERDNGEKYPRRTFTKQNLKHMGIGSVIVSLVWAGFSVKFNYKTGDVSIGAFGEDNVESVANEQPTSLKELEKQIAANKTAIHSHVLVDIQEMKDFKELLSERTARTDKRLTNIEEAIRELVREVHRQRN